MHRNFSIDLEPQLHLPAVNLQYRDFVQVMNAIFSNNHRFPFSP
jgi:hypothetical protein